jgi:hypothetical protein
LDAKPVRVRYDSRVVELGSGGGAQVTNLAPVSN